MTLLITGANGQIGSALATALAERDAIFWGRDEVDLSDSAALKAALAETPCSAIINAVAYTAVDRAEEEEALATRINGEAPGVMAVWCAQKNIPFIHYSTDYVFDGSGDSPRSEDAPTAPLNAYGRSKLAGEQAVTAAGGDTLIFRTSWVYDATGKNFLNTMLRLAQEREVLNIINDQTGAPSYAAHLARATVECLDKVQEMDVFPSGIYHMTGGGETTWYGFAQAIFEQARAMGWNLKIKEVNPITTDAYPTPAKRPHNSRLDGSKLREVFGVVMPDWRDALRECMEEKIHL